MSWVAGATPVAILSYGLWQRQYGGAADAIGKRPVPDFSDRLAVVRDFLPAQALAAVRDHVGTAAPVGRK